MSAEILNTADGILTVKIAGKLTLPELRAVQTQAAKILEGPNKMPILIFADNFQGWEPGGDWEDKSFQKKNDPFIGKIAMVGEKKWEELAFMFIGYRKFPVEYFKSDEIDKARAWLTNKS